MNLFRTLTLILGCVSFIIVVGGATYEHLAIVPVWSSAVPASLAMFQGEYGLNAARFWILIHPVTLLFLSLALILNWRTARRPFLLSTIVGYLIVLAVTSYYFVPELIAITQSEYSLNIDSGLTHRANRWELLSLLRLGFLLILAITLLFGLSKAAETPNR